MRIILWASSRLLYFVGLLCWLAAASPVVEASGFSYEILERIPGGIWAQCMLGGVVAWTCAATLHCLARLEEDSLKIRSLLANRR